MITRLLILIGFILLPFTFLRAQETIHIDSGYSWRAYTGCPTKLCHYYDMVGWDDSRYKEFAYWIGATPATPANNASDFMNFRVMFPNGYVKGSATKYPLIIMLHGLGESGRSPYGDNFSDVRYDNNGYNILHGGQEHQNAVLRSPSDSRAFPGIVVFPQTKGGSWVNDSDKVIKFLEHLVANYGVDINRIAIHGLSNGAKGVWDLTRARPDLFAAMLPMSGVPSYPNSEAADLFQTMPLWQFQGGLDVNPSPSGGESVKNAIQAAGGNPRYYLYPTLGHGTWTTAYAEPDFFSWILAQNKKNIYIYGGSNELCGSGSIKLGFSAGMASYQWTKDGADISGATTRFYTATTTGVYTVKFTRNGDATPYVSNSVTIVPKTSPPITPVLTSTGSLYYPYTRENNSTIGNTVSGVITSIVAPTGYSEYQWYKNGVLIATNSSNTRTLGQGSGTGTATTGPSAPSVIAANAGAWTVVVRENSGCLSNPSNVKTLYFNTATSAPYHSFPAGTNNGTYYTSIGQPAATVVSENSIRLTWTDNAPEEYFEIWRERRNSNGYTTQQGWTKIAEVPANTTSYLDNQGLRPQATYNYSVRAIANGDGRFSMMTKTNPYPQPAADTQPPTAPGGLTLTAVTESTISISWTPSTDNDVVYRYEVFEGEVSKGLLTNDVTGDLTDGNPAPPTTYTFTGLDPSSTYLLNVRAIDFAGNKSSFPEALIASTQTSANGLKYRYYAAGVTGTNGYKIEEPYNATRNGFNFATAVPTYTSTTSNPNNATAISNERQGTTDQNASNFVIAFDGFIQIDVAGVYRFYTRSDDGSRLYIDGALIVNNDFDQGETNRSGVTPSLSVGKHAIRVTFYELGGGNNLFVKYNQGTTDNYNSAIYIPDNKLFLTGTTLYNFYCKATGDLDDLATWGTNADGTGTAPVSFDNNLQLFNIANRTTAILTNDWSVTGTSSRVIVGSNITLDLDGALDAKLYADAGSTINLNNEFIPKFVQLNPTSTVNMNVNGTLPVAVYGNVNLKSAATSKLLPTNSISVKGNFSVDDQVTLIGNTTDRSTLSVGGNITFSGSSATPATLTERYKLILKGTANHSIAINDKDLNLFALEVEGGNVQLNFNSATARNLVLGTANGSGGLLLNDGAELELGLNNLTINGFYGVNPNNESGEISVNGGNIVFNSTNLKASNINFTNTDNLVNNLTVALGSTGQLSINNASQLRNLLTLSSGTLNLGAELKLISDASGTARIGPLLNGARVNGNVNFQRYMEGEGRIYRYISSPVKNYTVASLQQYIPVTGNFTGKSVIPGIPTSTASMFTYAGNNVYNPFPATGGTNLDTLKRAVGYTLLVREETAPTTWNATGSIHQGTIPFTLTGGTSDPNDGWNLIGNPYPSPLQWTNATTGGWTSSGVSATVSVRENFAGGYRWQVYRTGITSAGLNADQVISNGVIAPGQAFWVQTTTATPSLTVSENAKYTPNGGTFYRTGEVPTLDVLSIVLKSATQNDVTYILHDDAGTDNYEKVQDAVKQINSTGFFNLSTLSSDNIALAINATPASYCEKEIRLNITNAAAGNYTLELKGVEKYVRSTKAYFKDKYLNITKEITPDMVYSFSIISNVPASTGSGRFAISETPVILNNFALSATPACGGDAAVIVEAPQAGVKYQAFRDGIAVSEPFATEQGQLSIVVNKELLGTGKHTLNVQAGYTGCTTMLSNTATVSIVPDVATEQLLTASEGCDVNAAVHVANAQPNVAYQAFLNDVAVSEKFMSATAVDQLKLSLNKQLLNTGADTLTIFAGYSGCVADTLVQKAIVTVNADAFEVPQISNGMETLITSTENAGAYQWYLNNSKIDGATTRNYTPEKSGNYKVEVTNGSCVRESSAYSYLVTGIDEITKQGNGVYPNPFNDKVTVTLPANTRDGKITLRNVLGQVVAVKEVNLQSSNEMELDFSGVPAGSYILAIDKYKFKVVKRD